MARLTYAPLALAALFAAAGCSSKSSNTPTFDAPPPAPDAKPPDAGVPDAFSCALPTMECTTGTCTNTMSDPKNCGQCGMACTQGGADCFTGSCACPTPADFLPDSISGGALISQDVSQLHLLVDFAALTGANAQQNAFVLGLATNSTTTDFTLTAPSGGGGLPSPPIVAVGYNVNISSESVDAYYVAVSGTLHIDTFTCTANGSEAKGTLTNVKFQGATGNIGQLQFTVDPNGCTFTVDSLPFDITSTTACTP